MDIPRRTGYSVCDFPPTRFIPGATILLTGEFQTSDTLMDVLAQTDGRVAVKIWTKCSRAYQYGLPNGTDFNLRMI
jgi:hypothetical protein